MDVQLAYVIGHNQPVSIMVDTFGTGKTHENKKPDIISTVFDLSPRGIINDLDLLKPRYAPTAAYGHFGREESNFTWEKLDKVDQIKKLMD